MSAQPTACRNDVVNPEVFAWLAQSGTGATGERFPASQRGTIRLLCLVKKSLGTQTRRNCQIHKQRWFTQDEINRIVDAAPGQYKMLFRLAGFTGLRCGELCGVEDVKLDDGVVEVHRSVWNGSKAGLRRRPDGVPCFSTR
jgi:integrase